MDHQYRQPGNNYRRFADFSTSHTSLTHKKSRNATPLREAAPAILFSSGTAIGLLNELWSQLTEKSPLPPFVKGGSRASGGGILPFSTTRVGLLYENAITPVVRR